MYRTKNLSRSQLTRIMPPKRRIRFCLAIFLLLYVAFIFLLAIRQPITLITPSSIIQPILYDAYYNHSRISSSAASQREPNAAQIDREELIRSRGLSILGTDEKLTQIPFQPTDPSSNNSNNKTVILIWSGPEEIGDGNLGGCPDYDCEISRDYRLLNRSAAVLFTHGADTTPPVRYPWQYYVFFTQESPSHIQPIQPYRYFFNLTLSYRRDSDSPSPYGYAIERLEPRYKWKRNLTNLIAGKRKLVAWFVSHCGASSGRDAYVRELRKWIPVDIYGACGSLTCARNQGVSSSRQERRKPWSPDDEDEEELDSEMDQNDCDRMLESDYKFYIAFENSICKDYTTEKFWQKLTMWIVVIVLKRSIIEQYAPPGSFIAADDFESPAHLAAYLKRLDEDPIAYYHQLFDWRVRYRPIFLNGAVHDARERPWGFCALCSIAKRGTLRNSYEDVNAWWAKGGHCDNDFVDRMIAQRHSNNVLVKS